MATGRGPVYTVTDRTAPRKAADGGVAALAAKLTTTTRDNTPVDTGRLARSWLVVKAQIPGKYYVVTDVPYARDVEYGTRSRPPAAMLGRALAAYRTGGAR